MTTVALATPRRYEGRWNFMARLLVEVEDVGKTAEITTRPGE
jgi:hypothetical protein